jgi:hypothetical protein
LIVILGTPGVRAAFQMTLEMGEIMPDGEWNCTELPEEGVLVDVLAADNHGRYEIPFPVIFREDRWWNAHTGQELQAFVAGWRPSR